MEDLLPNVSSAVFGGKIPAYFAAFENLLVNGKNDGFILVGSWRLLTNRKIYLEYAKSFSMCKVEAESGISYSEVWRLLHLPILSNVVQDICFLAIHNKLPVRERMFRVGVTNDPYCQACTGAAILCDIEHYFCSCCRVQDVWTVVRQMVIIMTKEDISNWKMINFMWPKSRQEKETAWLMGTYLATSWQFLNVRETSILDKEEYFGFLKFKFKADQLGARHCLNPLPWLI